LFDFCRFFEILEIEPVIVDRTCVICQAAFKYDHLSRGRYRRTCSPKCRAAREIEQARAYRRQGRYPAKPRAKAIAKTCVICSSPFMASERRRQACGPACGNILGKRNGDIGRRRNAERRRQRTCQNCGTGFVMRNPSGAARAGRTHEGRFCSRNCATASQRLKCESAS
jgi:ribosomal protein S27AE